MKFPKQIQDCLEAFQRLPGVGQKSASRLAFYLLHVPESEINRLGNSILNLKKGINYCSICKNITEDSTCELCVDPKRERSEICVVESPLDVFSLESTGKYHGLYHVLHGVIDPLHNIGPEELYIEDLVSRLHRDSGDLKEIILALNPTMEGEATSMYIRNKIVESRKNVAITRLGIGMPIGGDVQYADETTLGRALDGRQKYN